MLQIGNLVDGKYKITRILGRGGSSCVFLAENVRLGNYWAIKEVYKGGVAGVISMSGKLIAESRILTRLRHPGLPAIIDVIETYDSYLIVMEYIEGISLDKVLEQRGPQSEEIVRKWGVQLSEVLYYLHTQQPAIIYRDMKPANVMLKPDGNVVLIDFGIAREVRAYGEQETNYLGTHGYAAPEQYNERRHTDARADVYGLGMTLYHLVTGQNPCVPPYGVQQIRVHNSNISADFEQIIYRCTKLEPEDRFQTVKELKGALLRNSDEESDRPTSHSNGLALVIVLIIVVVSVLLVSGIIAITNSDVDFGNSGLESMGSLFQDNNPTLVETEVYISYPEEWVATEFVPEESGYYIFSASSEDMAPVAWLYDWEGTTLASDNIYGSYEDMALSCWLEAGETYYLDMTLWKLDADMPATGSVTLYIELQE